ncbi:hypothetical protein [Caballeronia sp. LjRoot31]|uniref:hypothetical protein n=1 Tax=Caballeronia sp. LjRoot31 TaxID=3342324 RepID=UPI003ED00054
MKRVASMKGMAVRVVRHESMLGDDEASPLGLQGKVVWDEGNDEVVVAFEQEVSNARSATDQPNQAWIYRDWLENVM